MVDSNDTKYYPTQFLFNTDSFGFLISESGEEHNYQKAKEGSMNKLISEPSKNIDFDRAKQFHCELCQNCHWNKLKPFQDHISKLHSDIQGEFVDFPLPINGRYETIVKFVKEDIIKKLISESSQTMDFDRAKQFNCVLCLKGWKNWKSLQDHIYKFHSNIQGELRDFPLRINGRYETVLKFVNRKKSNKYACEVCQKDWNSMNELEKHLKENHAGVKGGLKIDVAYGKTIIKYVKIDVKDSGTIPIGLDTSVEVTNDQGKVDIINDPEEGLEESTVQEPLSIPMGRKKSKKYDCEVCQKDWDSMNDLKKHVKENHTGVKGELKVDVAYGKTIIKFVKNHVKDLGTIPIGKDTSDQVTNDQVKDIIDDPEVRHEESTVQEPLNVPMDRKKSKKYACELCQKDWDSMNDLEKHLKENHPGVKGELNIKMSHRKTTNTFVKNLVKDCNTIPIGFDVPVVTNDPAEDIIDDPGERDEQNIVQDPLNAAMDVKNQRPESNVCPRKMKNKGSNMMHNDTNILDFVEDIEFSDEIKPKFEAKEEKLKVESSGIDQKPNMVDSIMPNDTEMIDLVNNIEFSDNIKPKLDIEDKPIDLKRSSDDIKRKSEFMEETLNVKRSKIEQNPEMIEPKVPIDKEILGFVHKIEFVDDDKPKLKIKEELIDTKSSFSSIERKSEFMENCSELYNRVLKGKGTLEEMLIYKRLLDKQ